MKPPSASFRAPTAVGHFPRFSASSAWWCFYFFSVFALYLSDYIIALPLHNLILAIAVGVPLPRWMSFYRVINYTRHSAGFLFGVLLLWSESRLPPPGVLVQFFTHPTMGASPEFLWGLILQSLNLFSILLALGFLAISIVFALTRWRKYYFVPIALLVLGIGIVKFTKSVSGEVVLFSGDEIGVNNPATPAITDEEFEKSYLTGVPTQKPATPPPSQAISPNQNLTPDERLARFYEIEAGRRASFPDVANPDFDIILLQICSFGWEDFTEANVDMHPFFSQFDYIFTRFNSADSYSHTAGIRLLRGTCGQTSHNSLFQNAPAECYALDQLRSLGFETFTVFNHDGVYSDFSKLLSGSAKIDQPMSLASLKPNNTGFDDSPIYNDYDVLSFWLKNYAPRNKPAAMYYNSITLHAGTHGAEKDWWKQGNTSAFQSRLNELTPGLTRFFSELKTSGRRAVVVVVAEHGAALKSSPVQLQTIRQIPLPGITLVPAAVKIFGPGFNEEEKGMQTIINRPTSYLALYTLLGNLIRESPYSATRDTLKSAASNLPETAMISTSDTGTVIQSSAGFLYKNLNRPWEVLPKYITLPEVKLNLAP